MLDSSTDFYKMQKIARGELECIKWMNGGMEAASTGLDFAFVFQPYAFLGMGDPSRSFSLVKW